jgi:hypothetical protein
MSIDRTTTQHRLKDGIEALRRHRVRGRSLLEWQADADNEAAWCGWRAPPVSTSVCAL